MWSSITFMVPLAASVLGHGHVESIIADSKTYTAFLPVATPDFTADAPSIMRKVGGDDPVLDIVTSDITCNVGAEPIQESNGESRVGPVQAGSMVTFAWGKGWPHSGPMITYMAKCDPDCGSFTGTEGNVWFKIDEAAYDVENSQWATKELYNTNTWNVTVPECLEPGEYLIRHETISVGSCRTRGKCQFYPSCTQVKVQGQGTYAFGKDELVAFPGAYQPDDPKILWDTATQTKENYVPPGPPVFKCAA